jgi:TIR domain
VSKDPLKDFFISYNRADRSWAKWIKWQLDKAGYTTVLLPWNIPSDSNFEMEIEEAAIHAKRIILVLSPNYLNTFFTQEVFFLIFKHKAMEGKDKLLPICIQECREEFRKLLNSINHIDLSEEDETTACDMLLAAAHGKGIELTIQPIFPGQVGDKSPTFPGKGHVSLSPSGSTNNSFTPSSMSPTANSLVQQIHGAFTQKDWPDVIRKVDYLSRVASASLSPEIYHMQGRAFLEDGDKPRASESLYIALALTTNSSQRLKLLEEYTEVLTSLDRWSEVLRYSHEALRLKPNDTTWLALQQQSLSQLKSTHKGPLQAKSTLEASPTPQVSPTKTLKVFFSYSHKDEEMRFELEKYLKNLKKQRSISGWHDGEIGAGNEWDKEIKTHLSQADIVLLLISQDFIASDYCYNIEMKESLERHKKGEACVVPIILRHSTWKEEQLLHELQALPTGGKPITRWPDRDEAFVEVVKGIQKVVDRLTGNNVPR